MCTKFAACTTWTCGLRLFTTCPYFARSPQNIFRWDKNVPVYDPRITILSVRFKIRRNPQGNVSKRTSRTLTYASHAGTGKCYRCCLSSSSGLPIDRRTAPRPTAQASR
jgi:hypothetical protein